ncbi:MAG: ABC transporter ATP-binding protein [Balneolaceae bacterium]
MLKLENISKQFRAGKTIFSSVNFTFEPGEFIGLIGPNGSGKTTFLRLLSVNSYPTDGKVIYNGIDIHKDPQAFLKNVGLVHDEESLPMHLSAVELLEWVVRSREKWNEESLKKINSLLDTLSLMEDRDQQIGTYSTGMKKKTQIAAAFIIEPELLILDEPMRGLDVSTREIVLDMLIEAKKNGAIVLIASHTIDRSASYINSIIDFPLTNT